MEKSPLKNVLEEQTNVKPMSLLLAQLDITLDIVFDSIHFMDLGIMNKQQK